MVLFSIEHPCPDDAAPGAARTRPQRRFAVFKMAETDVVGFENIVKSNRDKIDPELLAAKICRRWRNGVPLMLSPDTDSPPGGIAPERLNDYDYVNAVGTGDPKGIRCPVGAHVRCINPRGQPVTGPFRACSRICAASVCALRRRIRFLFPCS
jgi:hypothetical protein